MRLEFDIDVDQPPSFDDVRTIIENCEIKKLTMVYWSKREKSEMKHKKVVQLARKHSIEVESVFHSGKSSMPLPHCKLPAEIWNYSSIFICHLTIQGSAGWGGRKGRSTEV